MAEQGGSCSQCAHLEHQVAQLRHENAELRRRVDRLERILSRARSACRNYLAQTGQVLASKSGVPRGIWAYARGGYAVAANLWGVLH